MSVDTLASGRVVVSNRDPSGSEAADIFHIVEDLRIGVTIGNDAQDRYVFGNIVSLAEDDLGNIYVADAHWKEIHVFGPAGDFLHSIGGRGEGPGEFRFLAGAIWDGASGVLWALDPLARRHKAFQRNGDFLTEHPYGTESRHAETVWQVYADTMGHLYEKDPDSAWRYLLRYSTTGVSGLLLSDSLLLPVVEPREYTREYDFGIATSPVPMEPELRLAVGPDGGVWLGRSDTFQIHRLAFSGDTLRTVELRRAPQLLQGRQRDSIAAAAGLSASMLPRYKPVMGAITVASDLWLWIAVTEGNHLRAWELFDDAGRYRGRVIPPEPLALVPAPLLGADAVLGVVEDDVGTQRVVRLRVMRKGGGDGVR